jgi:hypothetical protein
VEQVSSAYGDFIPPLKVVQIHKGVRTRKEVNMLELHLLEFHCSRGTNQARSTAADVIQHLS